MHDGHRLRATRWIARLPVSVSGAFVWAVFADEAISGNALCGIDEPVVMIDVDKRPTCKLMILQQAEGFGNGQNNLVFNVPAESVGNGAVHG